MVVLARLTAMLAMLGQGPASGPNIINYAPPIALFEGPFGPVAASPPLIVVAPGGGFFGPIPGPTVVPAVPTPMMVPAPLPVPALPPPRLPVGVLPARPAPRPDPGRAAELVRLGDRHFRAGDLPRASQRYQQAITAQPGMGQPRARMAQVELARGRYREAVDQLRAADTAEPGWIAFADSVRELYPEPADYHGMIAGIEAHLQAHPLDRDAWTMLGTQWLLSGHRQRAADVFLRLTDQPPDRLLETLLTLSGARR